MKTKKVLIVASGIIFVSALVTGLAVIVILLMSANDNIPAGRTTANDTTPSATQEQATQTQSNENNEDTVNFVYLHDERDNSLLRINLSDGSDTRFALGIGLDGSAYSSTLTFSDDGRLVAFCETETVNYTHNFIVRDIEAEENILDIPLGNIPGCRVSDFNDDGTEVTLNLVFNSPIENALNFPDEPNWAMRTIDVSTGLTTHDFNADSDNAPNYEAMQQTFWFEDGISAMTRAIHYGNNEILFIAFPYIGRDGPLRVPAHRWNFVSDTVTPVEGLTYLGASYLPETNEIVYPYLDEDYDAAQPPGPMPLANSIAIDNNGDIRTIYRNTDRIIANARFINGGRQIVTLLMSGFDEDNPASIGQTRFEIINRDGSTGQISSDFASNNQIFGTENGFIMMSISQMGADGNIHEIVEYRDGQMTSVWSFTPPEPNTWLAFVWSPPMPVVDGLAPFSSVE